MLENIPLRWAARAALQCPLLCREEKGALPVNGFSLATNKVGDFCSLTNTSRDLFLLARPRDTAPKPSSW